MTLQTPLLVKGRRESEWERGKGEGIDEELEEEAQAVANPWGREVARLPS